MKGTLKRVNDESTGFFRADFHMFAMYDMHYMVLFMAGWLKHGRFLSFYAVLFYCLLVLRANISIV